MKKLMLNIKSNYKEYSINTHRILTKKINKRSKIYLKKILLLRRVAGAEKYLEKLLLISISLKFYKKDSWIYKENFKKYHISLRL